MNLKINNKIKTNTLNFKIWKYLMVFSISILILLWLFQIIFLNKFYENSKINELNKTVSDIKELYTNNELYNSIDNIARDRGICIQVMIENTITYDSSSFNRGCMPDNPGFNYKKEFKDSLEENVTYKMINNRFNNEVLIKGLKLNDNIYVFLSTSLQPLDPAINILKNQFIVVSILVFIVSLIVSYFISKKLSKPIEDISNIASELKNGNYDVKFKVDEDIDEINKLVDTLNQATSDLSKTENLRREILANVSHDLKTPLTMIKAYSEMARDLNSRNKKKREEDLNIIIEETDRLNLLVNDILELSIIQSNTKELVKEKFDIVDLIKNILKKYDYLSDYKFIFNEKRTIFVYADKKRIEQVIYNLVNNAINYTLDNKVITIELEDLSSNVIVKVIDNGIGINKDEIDLIWKKYYKVDKTHKRDKVGTGIGLSIVESILKQHNFKYGVESIINKGTTFWFEIKKD